MWVNSEAYVLQMTFYFRDSSIIILALPAHQLLRAVPILVTLMIAVIRH
jgi:hypothetical protein